MHLNKIFNSALNDQTENIMWVLADRSCVLNNGLHKINGKGIVSANTTSVLCFLHFYPQRTRTGENNNFFCRTNSILVGSSYSFCNYFNPYFLPIIHIY